MVQQWNRGCGLWEWVDEEHTENSKDVINWLRDSKQKLEATVTALEQSLLEKDRVLQGLRDELAEGNVKKQEYFKSCTMEKDKSNMYLKWHRRLIVVLVVAVFILMQK